MRPFLIAGNWKMNCGPSQTASLVKKIIKKLPSLSNDVEVLVCPPEISLTSASQTIGDKPIALGAQNVHFESNGAYTGEVSTAMLTEAGCAFAITGHSERREYFGETNDIVNKKTEKILYDDLRPIICVGESLTERKENVHQQKVKEQVKVALSGIDSDHMQKVVIAYEPLWAIGTGETATPGQAQEMHRMIRTELADLYSEEAAQSTQILYGGSMKPHNAQSLLEQPDVDGGLIGGASLEAESFTEIIKIAKKV
jgi:triosephosphate isomerase